MPVGDGWLFEPVLWQFLHDSRMCMSLYYLTASENIHQVDCMWPWLKCIKFN